MKQNQPFMNARFIKHLLCIPMLLLSLSGSAQTSLTASISKTNVTCPGGADGTATVAVTGGGTAPYSYSWNTVPSQNTATASGLEAGTYTVYVVDAQGNLGSWSSSITEPPPVKLRKVYTNVTCFGANDGTATITVISGGTAPYSYSWLTSPPQLGQTAINLPPGKPKVITIDANGCEAKWTFKIDEPAEITTSTTTLNVSCNGASDGGATVVVSGGKAPYTYLWSTGETSNSISGKGPGTYVLTITDSKGCVKTKTVVITEPKILATSTQTTNVLCKGTTTGGATVTVTGGTKPYTYTWNSNPAQYSNILSNVGVGTYTLTIVDAKGCIKTKTVVITEPPTRIEVTATGSNVLCGNGENGTATASANGGTAPYTYTWSNGMIGSTISGLISGSYTVTAYDTKGCMATSAAVVISAPSAIVTTKTMENPKCYNGNDGWVCVNASGGTGNLTYMWNTGASTACLQGISAGNYSVTITDANGCEAIANFTLSNPAQLVASAIGVDITCNAAANGTATASAVGGTGAYTYSWDNGASTAAISGLVAGTYTVMVMDANACVASASAMVAEPAAIEIMETVNEPKCHNANDGSICVDAFGGTGAFTYSWNTGASNTQCLLNLGAGNYIVYATDANGCTAQYAHTFTNPAEILVTATATDITCNGGSNGMVAATVSGGIGQYNYSWSVLSETDAQISSLGAGTYTVYVTDENGCAAQASATVNEPAVISSTKTMEGPKCYGGNDGWVCVTANGGTGNLSYSWNTGATTSCLQGISAGNYTVTITDANGCEAQASFMLSNPAQLMASALATDITCNGVPNGTATASAVGGTGAYSYSWDNAATTAAISGLTAGTYTVMVMDANACVASASAMVAEPTAFVASVLATDITCNGAANGTATASAVGGTGAYSYTWNNGATTSAISGLAAGTYTVMVMDANACVASASAVVAEPAAMVLTAVATNNTCYSASNGMASVSVAGGSGFFTYAWSNGATTASITGLSSGNYTVTVTDTRGNCVEMASVTVVNPSQLTAVKTMANPNCNNGTNGWACVQAAGGTGTLSYSWNTGATTNCIYNLAAGSYSVVVTDANGCAGNWTIVLSNPTALSASTQTSNNSCHNAANGTASITIAGGTAPYSYTWSNGASTASVEWFSCRILYGNRNGFKRLFGYQNSMHHSTCCYSGGKNDVYTKMQQWE